MGLNPGRLDQTLILQVHARTPTTGGGSTIAWTNVYPAVIEPGEVKALSRSERVQAMQTDAPAEYEVQIRHRTDVTAKHRWYWEDEGLYLRIVSAPVNVGMRRERLSMLCAADRD